MKNQLHSLYTLLRPKAEFLFLLAAVVAGIWMVRPAHAAPPAPAVIPFPLMAAPLNITVDDQGTAWFTQPTANAISSLTVTSTVGAFQYSVRSYQVPTANSYPNDLAFDEGLVWFTERDGNQIGRLDVATGQITEYQVPTPASAPAGIAVAPDGRVWFAQGSTGKFGQLNPTTGLITEVDYDDPAAGFGQVQITQDGVVWALAGGSISALVGYQPNQGSFITVYIQDPNGRPTGTPRTFTVNLGNDLWVATSSPARYGTFLHGTLSVWLWSDYPDPAADLSTLAFGVPATQAPLSVRHAPVRRPAAIDTQFARLWMTDQANALATQIVPGAGGVEAQVVLRNAGNRITGMELDHANGVAWIAGNSASTVYLWQPPYVFRAHLPLLFQNTNR